MNTIHQTLYYEHTDYTLSFLQFDSILSKRAWMDGLRLSNIFWHSHWHLLQLSALHLLLHFSSTFLRLERGGLELGEDGEESDVM
jgi:hypothetical protein